MALLPREVTAAGSPGAIVRPQPFEGARAMGAAGETSFSWSLPKLRSASLVLVGSAMPAVAGMALSENSIKWLCVAWLACIALLLQSLSRRALANALVLSVDHYGILDRRLMTTHFGWHKIEGIYATNIGGSGVVEVELCGPLIPRDEYQWPVRTYDARVITISMLFLEGGVSDFLHAVSRYRPDLVRYRMRSAMNIEPRGPWL